MDRQVRIIITILLIITASTPLFAFESGFASWYGGKFQGRKTANGEIFDTNKLTAAHKTLPFNTIVKVTNLKNNRSVSVRINDRGPFVEGRVIDLSRAAAEKIDMTVSGVVLVELEIVSMPEGYTESDILKTEAVDPEGIPASYIIQIASFSKPDNAAKCLDRVNSSGLTAEVEVSDTGMLRIVIINIKKEEIERAKNLLNSLGFTNLLIRNN